MQPCEYQCPSPKGEVMSASDGYQMKRPVLLTVNACIIIGLSATAVAAGAVSIVYVLSISSSLFFASVLFTPGFLALGILVFCSVFRRHKAATTAVAVMFFVGSTLSAFAFGANVIEAFSDDASANLHFVVTFGSIGLAAIAYGVFCGLLWLRWGHQLTRKALEGQQG